MNLNESNFFFFFGTWLNVELHYPFIKRKLKPKDCVSSGKG